MEEFGADEALEGGMEAVRLGCWPVEGSVGSGLWDSGNLEVGGAVREQVPALHSPLSKSMAPWRRGWVPAVR